MKRISFSLYLLSYIMIILLCLTPLVAPSPLAFYLAYFFMGGWGVCLIAWMFTGGHLGGLLD